MDELFDAMEDPEFCFFIDDFSTAAHNISWGWGEGNFLTTLAHVMDRNGERY